MADAFFSYAREDTEIVRRIHAAMEAGETDVWVDWEGIPPTAEWMKEIYSAIEAADYFVFAVSPHSATSKVCGLEIDCALRHNKRIVPLLVQDLGEASLHPEVAKLNWIAFDHEEAFEHSLDALRTAVKTDLDYIRAHTRLLVRAREWEAQNQESSLLLRGADLAGAEELIHSDSEPAITPLQARYVSAGERATARRRRTIGAALVVALIVTIGLAVGALVQRSIAIENEQLAIQREATAKRLQFDSDMKLALREWESGRVEEATGLVAAHRDRAELFIWRYLNGLTQSDRAVAKVNRAMSVFLTGDGQTVYAGGDDTGLQRWDVGKQQAGQLSTPEDLVDSIDMSRDGRMLAWVQSGRIHLWDLESGERQEPPLPGVESVRFSPDGKRVAISCDPATVLWDVESRREVWRRPDRNFLGPASIAFIPGTSLLALGNDDGEIIVWDTGSDRQEARLQAPQGRKLYSLAASPDGRYLAAATTSHGQLELWEVDGWRRKQLAEVYHNSPTDGMLAFSPDGKLLASPNGSIVEIWDLQTSQVVKSYRGHNASISSLSWAAGGEFIASGSYDGTVRVWKALGDQRFSARELPIEWHPDEMLARMSTDRKYLVLGFAQLDVYNHRTLERITTLAHSQPVARMVFSADLALAATVTGPFEEQLDWPGPELRVWDLESGEVRSQPEIGGTWLTKVEFQDKGRRLRFEVEQEDETVSVHNVNIADGRLVETDDSTAASGEVGEQTASGTSRWAGVENVVVAPSGAGAAARQRDRIQFWPVSGGDPIQLSTHRAVVAEMAFSPDGQTLASITYTVLDEESPNGELKLWDAETGVELATFFLDKYLEQVGFTEDGTILSVMASDGQVFRFEAPHVGQAGIGAE